MSPQKNNHRQTNTAPEERMLNEPEESYTAIRSTNSTGFFFESEDDRLIKDATRPDSEKLQLFTQMLRRNAMFDKLQKK